MHITCKDCHLTGCVIVTKSAEAYRDKHAVKLVLTVSTTKLLGAEH